MQQQNPPLYYNILAQGKLIIIWKLIFIIRQDVGRRIQASSIQNKSQFDIHIKISESCDSIMHSKYYYANENVIDKWTDIFRESFDCN